MGSDTYVWAERSKEWRLENPKKPYLYKRYFGDEPERNELKRDNKVNFKPDVKYISGVYVFICETEKSVYVGQSKNIDNRLRNHKMNIVNDSGIGSKMYTKAKTHYHQHGIDAFVFKPHTFCIPVNDELLRIESEVMHQYVKDGYTLYNRSVNVSIRENEIYCDPKFKSIVMDVIEKIKDKEFLNKLKSIL